MKTVVLSPTNTTHVSDVLDSHYYGARYPKGTHRLFICRDDYQQGAFRVRSANELTRGNQSYRCAHSNDLIQTVRVLLEGGYEVFEFVTAQELFAWLSEPPAK